MTETSTNGGLRVELVQFRPRKGRVEENLARIGELAAEAAGRADLLVFPETALSGYFVEGGVTEVARTPAEVAAGLDEPPDGAPDLVLGFFEKGEGITYNAAAWLTPGPDGWKVVHRHRKLFLPTYGLFDEARFVSPGSGAEAFDTRFGRAGLLVCEDMLHSLVPATLAMDGAGLLVTVAASPGRDFRPGGDRPRSLDVWEVAARAITQEHGVHLVIAHSVGSEGGKLFPGTSTFYFPEGEVGPRGPLFEEGAVAAVLDGARIRRARARTSLLGDLRVMLPHLVRTWRESGFLGGQDGEAEGRPPKAPGVLDAAGPARDLPDPEDLSPLEIDAELVEKALVTFLKGEIVERRGFRNVVVGVSGGVDSAVSTYLAIRALGAEHVHPFLLPYATTSPESLDHARLVLDAAGLEGRTVDISAAVDAYVEAEEPELSGRRRGNLAARFRTLVLWDQAARLDALPLGTSNKSERLLGYFTWHADDSPPINPLGDLFKTQVLELARHLGVPGPVREKPPSPDLVPGVTDEDELGVAYRVADPILHWLLEGFTPEELVRAGFSEEAVTVVHRRLEGTHWKRKLPTVAVLSSTAVGEFYLRPVDY